MVRAVGSAAVYARISSDDGQALGVSRQLKDCGKLAASLGWAVGEEYVDNDISAYLGKLRPEYQRMLIDPADGARDAVLVYHVDRLTRRPIELEQFLDVLTAEKVAQVRFVAGGDLDIGNGDGLMVLRMLLAVATNESVTKSRRVKRKMEQNATAGLPHGGFRRPFGYAEHKITIVPAEAPAIRTLAERYVAGESLRSLASWLDAEGITTVGGGPWRTPTLRALLASGRIAGLREHQGQVLGPAVWEPCRSSPSSCAPGCWPGWASRPGPDGAARAAICCPGCCAAESAKGCCSAQPGRTPAATSAWVVRTTAAAAGSRWWPRRSRT